MNAATTDRAVFFVAAVFNFAVALALLVPESPAWAALDLVVPEHLLIPHLFIVMVAVFGLAYFWIGWAPEGKRALILIAVIGKLSVFAVVMAHYLAGSVTAALPVLASGDLGFALLFLRVFFRQHAMEGR